MYFGTCTFVQIEKRRATFNNRKNKIPLNPFGENKMSTNRRDFLKLDRASDVAADSRHFFEDQNFLACLAGFQCACHAGKTGTDNDDVIFVIK